MVTTTHQWVDTGHKNPLPNVELAPLNQQRVRDVLLHNNIGAGLYVLFQMFIMSIYACTTWKTAPEPRELLGFRRQSLSLGRKRVLLV